MKLIRLFLHERTVEIMLKILEAQEENKKIYPLQISNELGSPYSYISKVLGDFERNSLVESKHEGRIRSLYLTEFGIKIAKLLRELKIELNKDFNARKKLKILNNILENENDRDFRTLAPVLAELEIIGRTTHDEEVKRRVEKMRRIVEEMIQ